MPPVQNATQLLCVRASSSSGHYIASLPTARCSNIQWSRNLSRQKQICNARRLQKSRLESQNLNHQTKPNYYGQPKSERSSKLVWYTPPIKYTDSRTCSLPGIISKKEARHVHLEHPRPLLSHGLKHQERDSKLVRPTRVNIRMGGKPLFPPANRPLFVEGSSQCQIGRQPQVHRQKNDLSAPQGERQRKKSNRCARSGKSVQGPTKPVPLPTNGSGYFEWRHWDGRLWEASQLWAYHNSRHVYLQKRTRALLRQAQIDAKKCAEDQKLIWYDYYTRAQLLNDGAQIFQIHLFESEAIATLLRTAPTRFRSRFASTVAHLDAIARDLHRLVVEVRELQRLRLNHFPLNYYPLETGAGINAQTLEQIESSCNTSPQLWTIEPMIVSLALVIHRLSGELQAFSRFRMTNSRSFPWQYILRSQRLQQAIQHNIWEMSELGHELKALRYYWLSKCLISPSHPRITAGKQLWDQIWKYIIPNDQYSFVISSKGSILRTNASGYFSWNTWDGGGWNLELFQSYTSALPVRAAASARAQYQAVAMRAQSKIPHRIRAYLLGYYHSLRQANEALIPHRRLTIDINVVLFLLRTAPPTISRRLKGTLQALSQVTFDMNDDLEDVRVLQTTLACLSPSPFLFRSLAIRHAATYNAIRLLQNNKSVQKSLRLNYKAMSGMDWISHMGEYQRQDKQFVKEIINRAPKHAEIWDRQFPCYVAEPCYNAIGRIVSMYRKVKDASVYAKPEIIFYSSFSRWRMVDAIILHMNQLVNDVLLLARYFTAMRYYRAQHFLSGISAGEMFVPPELLRRNVQFSRSRNEKTGQRERTDRNSPTKHKVRKSLTSVRCERAGKTPRLRKRLRSLSKHDKHDRHDKQVSQGSVERPLYTRSGRRMWAP